jgi:hypothetical protein
LRADCLNWRHRGGHSGAALQARAQFIEGRPLGDLANLTEQVIGERHARQRRARFEPTVQRGLTRIVGPHADPSMGWRSANTPGAVGSLDEKHRFLAGACKSYRFVIIPRNEVGFRR